MGVRVYVSPIVEAINLINECFIYLSRDVSYSFVFGYLHCIFSINPHTVKLSILIYDIRCSNACYPDSVNCVLRKLLDGRVKCKASLYIDRKTTYLILDKDGWLVRYANLRQFLHEM